MSTNKHLSTRQIIFEWRFMYLLLFLLLMISLQPLQERFMWLDIILDIVITSVLFAAINAVSENKNQTVAGVLLALPMLAATWATSLVDRPWLDMAAAICGIAFFIVLALATFSFIIKQDDVTRDLISGAAVVYLLLAIIWMFIYSIIEMLQPGSFNVAQGDIIGQNYPLMYYSLVTITTLGYGDIFPVTTAARSFASLEALIGQIYLVFTVARLVGIHTSQTMNRTKKGPS